MSNFVTRAGSRVSNFSAGLVTAFYAKFVPSTIEGLFGVFGYAVRALDRSVKASEARLTVERKFRSSLYRSEDASFARSVGALSDIDRVKRIKGRLEDFLA